MKLSVREAVHKERGHWHFDWTKRTEDLIWYHKKFPKEHCDRLVQGIQKVIDDRWMDKDDQILQIMNPAWVKKPNMGFGTQEHPELAKDMQDSVGTWVGSRIDVRRPWMISLNPKDVPELNKQLQDSLTEVNWLDGKSLDAVDVRFAVQMPGMITFNHIDHIFVRYEERKDRFEMPKLGRKYYTLLTERQQGQYVQWGSKLLSNWEPGLTFTWNWGLPHWTCNYSDSPRMSMMIRLKEDVVLGDA